MRKLVGLLTILLFTGSIFAQGIILEEGSVGTALKKVTYIDNITINPNTKVVTVRTYVSWQTSEGEEIKRDRGETIVLRDEKDNPDTKENEAKARYADFVKETGLDFSAIVKAVKEKIQAEKKKEISK